MTKLNTTSFFVSPLFIKTTDKTISLGKDRAIKLRDFQLKLLDIFLEDSYNVIFLSAPTGAGKTLTLLIPLFANLEKSWIYHGSIGIYPSKELAKDQMDTISNILQELGATLADISEYFPSLASADQLKKVVLKEQLRIFEFEVGNYGKIPILLMLVVSDSLKTLREALKLRNNKEVLKYVWENIGGRAFRIIFTVPEYPYLLTTATFQDFHKAGVWLYRVYKELASFLKIIEKRDEKSLQVLESWFRSLEEKIGRKRIFEEYYTSRRFINELSELFLPFRAPVFFDEFHLYSGFSLASFVGLLYIYLLQRGIKKIVISSATPEKIVLVRGTKKDFLELVRRLSEKMGYDVKRIKAFITSAPKEGYDQIRKRTRIEIVPVILRGKQVTGAPAYGVIQRYVPEVLEKTEWLNKYRCKGKSMIIVDRVASVLQVKEAVEDLTGETPLTICSIKNLILDNLSQTSLREAKLVVGNMAIAFGIDIKGMDLGVVVAKDYPSALQKIGRFGRGSGGDLAEIYLPIPFFKYREVEAILKNLQGKEIPYTQSNGNRGTVDFVTVLRLLYPRMSPDILLRKKVGVLKAIIPAWVYTFARIIGERDTIREKLHTAKEIREVPMLSSFAIMLRELENYFETRDMKKRLAKYLEKRVSLTPKGFYNLYSFRTIAGVTIKRSTKDREIEEHADLATAGRNIPLEVVHGEFVVSNVGKRKLYEYAILWIGVDKKNENPIIELLSLLDRSVVSMRFLLEFLRDYEIYLFQGSRKLCKINTLLYNEELAEIPVYVIYANNKGTKQFIDYLSAVESAIPIYTYSYYGGSYSVVKLLGGIYML